MDDLEKYARERESREPGFLKKLQKVEELSMKEPHIRAHDLSFRNRKALEESEICGCFYCLKTCVASDVKKWIDRRKGTEETALCPHCGIDSLLGSSSGYPITTEFLQKMQEYWFKPCFSDS